MKARAFQNCLRSLQGNSPLAVSYGHQPTHPNYRDIAALVVGCALVFAIGIFA